MKKEAIVLGLVIAALAAYLVFHDANRTGYQLPSLAQVTAAELTKIEITRNGNTIRLNRKGDDWFIGDQAWPADETEVSRITSAIADLRLTALVSAAKAYARYDLDEAKKITVTAWAGEKQARRFDIGKLAETFQHTFVMLPDNPNVYHAMDNIKRLFDHSADDLRDKRVMTVKADEIKEIVLAGEGGTTTITREELSETASTPEDQAEDAPTPDKTKQQIRWKTAAGREIDPALVRGLLSKLSHVTCSAYIEDQKKEDFTHPIRTITLTGKSATTLSLFKKTDKGYPAVTTENAYPFLLRDYFVNDIQKQIDTLSTNTES